MASPRAAAIASPRTPVALLTAALLSIIMLLAPALRAEALPVAYTNQADYLSALSGMGLTPVHEGFEGDGAWGGVRSSIVGGAQLAPSVTSKGVTWTSNFAAGQITTGAGPARTGNWGFYAIPHGSYDAGNPDCFTPGLCGDGWQGAAQAGEVLYGVGGWIDTNTPPAELGLFLGGYPNTPIDFGETCDGSGDCVDNSSLGTAMKFFGVIDPVGFSMFEFRELEGKLEPGGGDLKYIFADDFYIAGSALTAPAIPAPAALPLMIGALGLLAACGRRRITSPSR